jgi:arsenite methyltransferase
MVTDRSQGTITPSSPYVFSSMKTLSLADALERVDRAFSIQAVLQDFDRNVIPVYYRQSDRGYRFYHSEAGSLHMALNEDGQFNRQGYYTQPRFVASQAAEISAQRLLEVGCGKGFNSQFIAQHHPQLQITGIDITQSNLDIAQRKAAQLSNFTVGPGNFNAIPHPDQQFDLAFGIECLCYSLDNSQTLTELHRVLAPGGRLVVFDAYRNPGFENFSSDLQTATKLIEASMAVQGGMNRIDHWQTASEAVGLRTLESTDVTAATRPNIDRFYRLATRYFSSNDLIRRVTRWWQPYLMRNAIVGLLSPMVLDAGVLGYYRVVAERPGDGRPST